MVPSMEVVDQFRLEIKVIGGWDFGVDFDKG